MIKKFVVLMGISVLVNAQVYALDCKVLDYNKETDIMMLKCEPKYTKVKMNDNVKVIKVNKRNCDD